MATHFTISKSADSSNKASRPASAISLSSSGVSRIGIKKKTGGVSFVAIIGNSAIVASLLGLAVLGIYLSALHGRKKTYDITQQIAVFKQPDRPIPVLPAPVDVPEIIRRAEVNKTPPAQDKREIIQTAPRIASAPVQVIEPNVIQMSQETMPPLMVDKLEDQPAPKPDEATAAPALPVAKNDRPEGIEKLPDTEKPAKDPNTENFGTGITFLKKPQAFDKASKESKLVMILRFEGAFEKDAFTCQQPELLRKNALMDDDVATYISQHFVATSEKHSPSKVTPRGGKPAGIVTTYFCIPGSEGREPKVVHAIPGVVEAAEFLEEAQWIADTKGEAPKIKGHDHVKFVAFVQKSHREHFMEEYEKHFGGARGPGFLRMGGPFGGMPAARGLGMRMPGVKPTFPATLPTELSAQLQAHWVLSTLSGYSITKAALEIETISRAKAKMMER